MRIDQYLYKNGHAISRNKASELVKSGAVFVNGRNIIKPSHAMFEGDVVLVREANQYVARSAKKLLYAVECFKLNVEGLVVIDVGSSTGGFTEVLLRQGVQHVYAIDVGTDQLAERLRSDNRLTSLEKTDIRDVDQLPNLADLAVVDVSFVSLRRIIPSILPLLKNDGELVVLFKPQFEVDAMHRGKSGIVRSPQAVKKAIVALRDFFEENGLQVIAEVPSPIKGKAGNQEFLMHLKKHG